MVATDKKKSLWKYIVYNRYMYLMLVPGLLYILIFDYLPMGGIIIAFQDFNPFIGFLKSPWVGFDNFQKLFTTPRFWEILRNTLLISTYKLVWGFPAPIILALMLNEVRHRRYKRTLQTIYYLPHFISWVVIGGIMQSLLSVEYGMLKEIFELFNIKKFNLLGSTKYFRSLLVMSDVWRGAGWGTIIYLAAISNIDPELYEAARIDGAGRLKQAWFITMPGILSVTVLQLILAIGGLMNAGFDQIMALQRPVVQSVSDIFETYIYRTGLGGGKYSFTTALGLFKSVVSTTLIISADFLSKKVSGEGLF